MKLRGRLVGHVEHAGPLPTRVHCLGLLELTNASAAASCHGGEPLRQRSRRRWPLPSHWARTRRRLRRRVRRRLPLPPHRGRLHELPLRGGLEGREGGAGQELPRRPLLRVQQRPLLHARLRRAARSSRA